MAELGLIGYHEKHNILVIPGDLPYLHAQDNEPEQTRFNGSTGGRPGLPVAGQETHTAAQRWA